MERLVAGRPPAITLVLEGPHNSWSARKYFDLLADRRKAAVQFLGVRGYDLTDEVASQGIYPDLTLRFQQPGYSNDFIQTERISPDEIRDPRISEPRERTVPMGLSPELQAKLQSLREQFPDAWKLGELCAEQEFDNITGASAFRPQFDMLYGWEDTVPDTEADITKFAQAVTPSAVQNIGIEMAKSAGSQIAIPNAVMETAGLAFMTTFHALLTQRANS